MILNPLRLYRRRRRLKQEALEEAQYLRRRHGDAALEAVAEQLQRRDLTSWGREVMELARHYLRTKV